MKSNFPGFMLHTERHFSDITLPSIRVERRLLLKAHRVINDDRALSAFPLKDNFPFCFVLGFSPSHLRVIHGNESGEWKHIAALGVATYRQPVLI